MAMQWESAQFRLDGQVAAVPLRLSLLAGDLVHNLRSALDHAVYQLVLGDKREPTTRTQWPMFSESQSAAPCRATTLNLRASKTMMPGI
jgi:hypothetical protein